MTGTSALGQSIRTFEDKKTECLAYLDQAEELAREFFADFPDVGGAGTASLNLAQLAATRGKIEAENLRILIAGQFKTGKSTLINAMLGEKILPAYSTPCTAVITAIEYGSKPRAILEFKPEPGSVPEGLDSRLKKHLEACGGQPAELEIDPGSSGELEKFLTIDETADDQAEGVAATPISSCRLYWPLELCHGGAVIIDSPGLNENAARDRTTLDYVPNADMIVHVLNASQPYGLPDKQFIQTLRSIGEFPLMFVVNRFDLLNSDQERERVARYIRHNLASACAYGEDGIFFTSAEKALAGRLSGDPALLEASGVPRFEESLGAILGRERAAMKLGHIRGVVRDAAQVADDYLPRLAEELSASEKELGERLARQQAIFDRMERRIKRIRDMCAEEINTFQEALSREMALLFVDYANHAMATDIDMVDIDDCDAGSGPGRDKAIARLLAATDAGLKEIMGRWADGEGKGLYEQTLRRILEKLESEIEDFNMLVTSLRGGFSIPPSAPTPGSISLSDRDNMLFIAGGLVAGGGVAGMAAALLLPARFLVVAGPAGWVINGLLAALGAGLAFWSRQQARGALKEAYLREARKTIGGKAREWAAEMAEDAADRMGESLLPILEGLERQAADAKRPILNAIAALQADKGDAREQTEKLAAYAKRFQRLKEAGAKLVESL